MFYKITILLILFFSLSVFTIVYVGIVEITEPRIDPFSCLFAGVENDDMENVLLGIKCMIKAMLFWWIHKSILLDWTGNIHKEIHKFLMYMAFLYSLYPRTGWVSKRKMNIDTFVKGMESLFYFFSIFNYFSSS